MPMSRNTEDNDVGCAPPKSSSEVLVHVRTTVVQGATHINRLHRKGLGYTHEPAQVQLKT